MTVYFAHATSFCGAVWNPVIDELGESDCLSWDFAGHGSAATPALPFSWETFGAQVLDETTPGGIGVGHSMGACALVMAQLQDRARFRFLVLVEPVIFPGPHGRLDHPLGVIASKRRQEFPDRESARGNLKSKAAFAPWQDGALDAYLDCGFVGEGPVRLACDPEFEAEVYRTSNDHDTWEHLNEIEIPVLLIAGEDSDTTPPEVVRQQAAQFRRAGIEIVAGTGHFLPMEMPDLVADRVRRVVESVV